MAEHMDLSKRLRGANGIVQGQHFDPGAALAIAVDQLPKEGE